VNLKYLIKLRANIQNIQKKCVFKKV
jgi:hypothetical protein